MIFFPEQLSPLLFDTGTLQRASVMGIVRGRDHVTGTTIIFYRPPCGFWTGTSSTSHVLSLSFSYGAMRVYQILVCVISTRIRTMSFSRHNPPTQGRCHHWNVVTPTSLCGREHHLKLPLWHKCATLSVSNYWRVWQKGSCQQWNAPTSSRGSWRGTTGTLTVVLDVMSRTQHMSNIWYVLNV